MKIKLIAVVLFSIVTSGCITMCNVAECFDPVPYSGMFTTSYWGENYEIDGVKYVDTMEARFPIGFFGACNVYFWRAFGDYRKTCTYTRYKEWDNLPGREKGKVIATFKMVDGRLIRIK